MVACLWQVQPSAERFSHGAFVNKHPTEMHIAHQFFGTNTDVRVSTAELTIAPGTTYIKGVNAYLQADTATLEIIPTADLVSNAYRTIIKMSGQVFIRGWSTSLNAGTAPIIPVPSFDGANSKNVVIWSQMIITGQWSIPAIPKVYKNPSVWRRCPTDRIDHISLIHPLFKTDEINPQRVGEEFFELSERIGSETHVHLTPTESERIIVAQISVEATLKLTAEVDTWFNSLIEANILPCPITPIVKRYALTTLTSSMSEATVKMELGDKMRSATFTVEDRKLADFDEIIFTMPDYNGVDQTVFVGFIPSSSAVYEAASGMTTLTAYDYAWYLTMQYPSDADKSLLSWEQQYNNVAWRLSYMGNDNPYLNFYPGDWIVGELSGHIGKVYSVTRTGGVGHGILILTDVEGIPYHDINGDEYFFWWGDDGDGGGVHGEQLFVNSVPIAWNDGHTTETSLAYGETEKVMYPDEWVRRLLGGNEWQKVTGIYPYRLTPISGWTAMGKSFTWDEKTTKIKAIEEVCEYCNHMFFVKWKTISGTLRPCAYFIPFTSIDSVGAGLDLPSRVNFVKSTDKYVVEPIKEEVIGDEKYNKVTVKCIGWDGTWYSSVKQTDDCAAGLDKPIEYFEICDFAEDQASCDSRCNILFYYYRNPIKKWSVTILDHPALELYQTVAFFGFTDQIDQVTMRIVKVSHTISEGGTTNETSITIIPDSQFAAYISVSRMFTGTVSETEAIANSVVNERGAIETGTVVAVNPDGSVVVKNDRGLTMLARDAS